MNRFSTKALSSTFALALLSTLFVSAQPALALGGPDADAVMGQSGSLTGGQTGTGPTRFKNVGGMAHDDVHHRLFVSDYTNNRVDVFNLNADNTLPDDTADLVIGQPDFATLTAGTTSATLANPRGLAYDPTNDRLYVSDSSNRRVMVFNTSTITNGMAATYVLGQPDFVTKTAGVTQSKIDISLNVALGQNNRYLFATDQNNRRVMVWDTNAIATGMNASYVLGQADFVSNGYFNTQKSTYVPYGVAVDVNLNRLYVAENGSNRVSVFDLSALANNMNALYVIGQSSFTGAAYGFTQTTLYAPVAVTVGGGRIFVAQNGSHRVTVYDANNTSNGQPAISVYGQPDYTSSTPNNGGLNAGTLGYPTNVSWDPSTARLFVADGNVRVLIFNSPTIGTPFAVSVAGVFSFTVAGHASACNSVTPTGTSGPTSLDLAHVSAGNSSIAAQDLVVASNLPGGFTVYQSGTQLTGPRAIAAVGGTNASPAAFGSSEAYGYTTNDVNLTRFAGPLWASVSSTQSPVLSLTTNASVTSCVAYQFKSAAATPAGTYTGTVLYSAVPVF